ncbi:LysR substrate-binding domain-containing protein [Stenotrophomonas maltophilia]|uniref:LysR substrate-binding domain-containing protein n=1 Tax=Stenotrophomonas maltophilia TaxID=40324 RepID=UPI001310E561|nr:LysR substrate-binding domain-containing protein [Stenotrophomonas maltophilia]MBA0284375.1 LysR family transcriptional regulator [Stenotrophomonas maltophilia]MBA0324512.1 LysR family transcriptional regulator [Stenotrophomonas maltophilia]
MGAVLPLLGLRAFVETGRHGSLTAAADAMGVTPGAISQQLRQLQERLGVSLFDRTRHGVVLSAAGARVYPELLQAFDQIAQSLQTLERWETRCTLRISAAPSFAAQWLAPRLGAFSALHPQVDVQLDSSAALSNLRRDGVDIAIRHGLGRYAGLHAEHLMAPVLLPVASPALLAGAPTVSSVQDCLQLPLLQDADRSDWRLWFQALDLPVDERLERGPAFDDDLLLIRAAVAGQGIALVRDIHAAEELANGRLQVVIDQPWPQAFAYYAVTRADGEANAAIPAFMTWLHAALMTPQEAGTHTLQDAG